MSKRVVEKMRGEVPAVYQNAGELSDNKMIRDMDVEQLEKLFAVIAGDIYMRGGVRLTPIPPFILIRVVPKEMATAGGILLPDVKQNKPAAEGIVLEVYKPYDEEVVLSKGTMMERVGKLHREAPVSVGQRVLFPYYEGVEYGILGENYKLIRCAADQIKFPYMQVLGVLEYDGDLLLQSKIVALMNKFRSKTVSGEAVSRGA